MTVKISQLPAGAALTGVEEVPVVQSSSTVRTLVSAIGTYVRGLFTTTPLTIAEGGTGESTQTDALTALLGSSVIPLANGGTAGNDAASARNALGAAEKGINADITEITGLTTALTIAQGGTGAKTAALARAALAAVSLSSLKLNIQVFTASGTYTPTAGMVYAVAKGVGGGGAGGGASASFLGGGGGGGGAQTAIKVMTAADVGASQTVTIGAGGTGIVAGAGNSGGDTSLGTLLVAKGASGGSNGSTTASAALGGGTLSGGTGDVLISGGTGGSGIGATNNVCRGGAGGSSTAGQGAPDNVAATAITSSLGSAGTGYGSGGSGAVQVGSGSTFAGGPGKSGILIIIELVATS